MRARAEIRVVGARCTVLRSDPPFTFRETSAGLSWVGTAAGPVGGDDLALDIDVAAGGELVLSSVAASLVHPGPAGEPSTTRIRATVGAGAALRWRPRPAVLIDGCDHRTVTRLDLAAGACVEWREEVVLGRHDAGPGSLLQRLAVDVDGVPLLRSDLAVGPRWPGSSGPAGTAGARAVGTVLLVGAGVPPVPEHPGVRVAVQQLTGTAVLITALAGKPGALGRALDEVVRDAVQASAPAPGGTGGPCCSSVSSWP